MPTVITKTPTRTDLILGAIITAVDEGYRGEIDGDRFLVGLMVVVKLKADGTPRAVIVSRESQVAVTSELSKEVKPI